MVRLSSLCERFGRCDAISGKGWQCHFPAKIEGLCMTHWWRYAEGEEVKRCKGE